MNDPREYLAPGVSGWRKRQFAAQARNVDSEARQQKNEIRRKRREYEDARAAYVNQAKAEGKDPDEAMREFDKTFSQGGGAKIEPEPEPTPEVEDSEPQRSPENMDRGELVAELEAAGEKAHPNAKDSTLRKKVEALRGTDD